MRFVDRDLFRSRRLKDLAPLLKQAEQATKALHRNYSQHGREFRFAPRIWSEYRPLLKDLFLSKCAYCESTVGVTSPGGIDNFRPKRHYWWLAYEWKNLLFACAACNTYKGDRFPVEGKQATSPAAMSKERPLLLDPTLDQPEQHLVFRYDASSASVRVEGRTEQGRTSIMVLGLNRESLVRSRAERWLQFRFLLHAAASSKDPSQDVFSSLKEGLSDSAEYVAAIRQLARRWFEDLKGELPTQFRNLLIGAAPTISAKVRKAAREDTAKMRASLSAYTVEHASKDARGKFASTARRIERIQVHNLRAIEDLDVLVPDPVENESWIMAVGENGVGKSSLLQGVALALMGQKHANARKLNAADFVRRGARDKKGFVRVHVSGVGPIELRFRSNSPMFEVDPPDPKVPLLAYGPNRLLPRNTAQRAVEDRNIRMENLFDPTIPLCDADEWMRRLHREDKRAFQDIGRAICRLLMLRDRPGPRIEKGMAMVKTPDGWRPIRQLSDGYQSMLALVVDIAIGTTGTHRSPEEAEGIVILDEIEVHLHPQWKISIVERFRQCFPKLNFLVTTHDPLCLKGLRDNEILILRRDARGKVTYTADVPSVHQMKTDDILMSDLFELRSARNTGFSLTLARYSELLNKVRRSVKEERELAKLRRRVGATLAGTLTPMQKQVSGALMAVMKHLRLGKRGQALTHDVVAEVQRQVSRIGTGT
jgi:uncharacterized protein (TIGR02646 family)